MRHAPSRASAFLGVGLAGMLSRFKHCLNIQFLPISASPTARKPLIFMIGKEQMQLRMLLIGYNLVIETSQL
jgi:hypothetical protein